MAKKVKKRSYVTKKKELSQIMQVGVVFIIVMAMLLLMYAAKTTP